MYAEAVESLSRHADDNDEGLLTEAAGTAAGTAAGVDETAGLEWASVVASAEYGAGVCLRKLGKK